MINQQLTFNDIKNGLKSAEAKTRKRSVLFLSRIDQPEVIDLLTPLLDDPLEDIRETCKKIISFLTQKYGHSKELLSQEEKFKVKNEIATAAFDPNKLLQLIVVDDPKIKIASIMSFYGVKNEQVMILFKKFLQLETDETVIATYIKAISSIGGCNEINFIRKFLFHNDNRVKSNTVEALWELGAYEEIIDDILPLVESDNERLRITATQYLSRIDIDVFLSEMNRIKKLDNDNLMNAAIKISLLHEIDKTLDYYKNNFDLLKPNQKNMIVDFWQTSYNDEAKNFLLSKGYGHKNEIDNSIDRPFIINQDKSIFEIENELKMTDDYYYQFGLKLLEAKQFAESINEFDNVLKINPKHFKAWRERGKAFMGIQNYDSAIYCFNKAIALAPDDIDTWECKKNTFNEIFDDNAANICTQKIKHLKNISQIPLDENSDNINAKINLENHIAKNKLLNDPSSNLNTIGSEETKTCPRCQKNNNINKNNCSKCGFKFANIEQSYNCPECGFLLSSIVNNCPECGFEISHEVKTFSKVTSNKITKQQTVNSSTHQNIQMKICPECGGELKANLNNCPECGYEIQAENKPTSFNNKQKVVSTSPSTKIKTCPECGVELKANLSTCPECGYEIQAENKPTSFNNKQKVVSTSPSTKTQTCPECGFELKANLNTCPECGYEIQAENKPTSFNNKQKVVSTSPSTKIKTCSECGFELKANLKSCPECGCEIINNFS